MTHIDLPILPGALAKALAEYAASRGERLVVERIAGCTVYRFVPVGAP